MMCRPSSLGTKGGRHLLQHTIGERCNVWEYLDIHRQAQLLQSVYVDDFKMVGRKASWAPMCRKLRKHTDLESSTPLAGRAGCKSFVQASLA